MAGRGAIVRSSSHHVLGVLPHRRRPIEAVGVLRTARGADRWLRGYVAAESVDIRRRLGVRHPGLRGVAAGPLRSAALRLAFAWRCLR